MTGLMAAIVIGYLLGSIPFGLLLPRLFGYGDIRRIGSGNIGATNVLRTGNKILAFLTLVLDALKGALAVGAGALMGAGLAGFPPYAAGIAAFAGHIFPVWLGFRGGKGVAVSLGVFLTAAPFAGLLGLLTWAAVAVTSRISSLAALVTAILMPAYAFFLHGQRPALMALVMAVLVFWTHRENIKRLLRGEESRIGAQK